MKILLVYPRFSPYSSPPLGVAYLASYLKSHDFYVDILDCTFESKKSAKSRLLSKDWDIVGFSVMTPMMEDVIELVHELNKAQKKPLVVFGGAHPTAVPEDSLNYCDVVCLGESESSFYELCVAFRDKKPFDGVKGIYYKKGGKIKFTGARDYIDNLDKIPFPARDLLPMDLYMKNKSGRQRWCIPQPSTSMIATRGCPASCTYCATKYIHGRKIRYRSVKNVIDEIKLLKIKYNVRSIYFNDDTFTANLPWLTELCKELKKLKIKWSTNTRVDLIDEHKLRMMKNAGCSFISFGIESGSQEILSRILKKGTTLEKIKQAFDLTSEIGIMNQGTCMIGIPGETKEDIEKTIKFVKKLNADSVQFSVFVPFPGTEIYDYVKANGKLTYTSWSDFNYYDKPIFEMPNLKREEIMHLIKKGYISFYLRPSYFFKQIYKMRNKEYFVQMSNGFYNLFTKLVLRK